MMEEEAPQPEMPPPPEGVPPPPAEGVPPPAPDGAPVEVPPEGEAAPPEKPRKKPARKKPSYQLKLFERWDLSEVVVHDKGLERYINLSPIVLPHTAGRHANKPFGKGRTNIVERVINNIMRSEMYTGKKSKAIAVVRQAFEIVEAQAKRNPVQVLVDALEKAAPREEVTRLRFGGISVPRAVDVAPSRRLDMALRNVCGGAVQSSFKSPKPIEECLADEILKASRGEIESAAISKKEELERIAVSAR